MTDYSKSKIYSIKFNNEIVYIGSTIQKLNNRFNSHKYNSKNLDTNLYNFMKDKELNDFEIVLLEEYSCNTKKELFEREAYYQRLYPNLLNNHFASSTEEEHKIKVSKWNKDFREKHIDSARATERISKSKYRDKCKVGFDCECGTHLTTTLTYARHLKSQKHLNFIANQNV